MAQNSFVYDPSASMRESFKDISTNIGTAFTNIIAQKQQDLALADKVFQNLDAIKEETSAIGSQRINQTIKELTSAAPNVMFKDGKIDHEGMGKIMAGVSQVKGLKNWWSQVGELKKQSLQLATATVKDMTNFASYVSQLDPLIAENEGGSLNDLKSKLASLYDSHLDYTNMGRDKIASLFPVDKYVGEMENEKKGITEYSFTGPSRLFQFNPKTSKVELAPPTPVTDPATGKPVIDPTTGQPKMISSLEKAKAALGPEFLAKYKGHLGVSPALVTDESATMQILNSFATAPAFKETKSFEKRQTEKNELKTSTVEADFAKTFANLKVATMNASIKASIAQANKYNAATGGKTGVPKNAVIPVIGQTTVPGKGKERVVVSKYMSLTKPVTVTVTGANVNTGQKDEKGNDVMRIGTAQTSGKPTEFEITKISIDKNRKIWATGNTPQALGRKGVVKQVMLSPTDYDEFVNKLGGMEAVHRYSNSVGLHALGLTDLPKSYLNIPQDTTPDKGWDPVDPVE